MLACCDEFDPSVFWTEQNHYKACWYGLARTFCRTIPARVWAQATDDLPTWLANQVVRLGNYTASPAVQAWCIGEFYEEGGIKDLPLGDGVEIFSHFFDITMAPDYETEEDWNAINDPWIEITSAEMWDIYLPPNSNEILTCESGQDNHDQVLVEGLEEPGLTQKTVAEGDLELDGPTLSGRHISGTAVLSGSRAQCPGLHCTEVGFKQDAGVDWTLYRFTMHAESGAAAVDWGTTTVASVERLAVRLMTPVIGEANPTGAVQFTVPAGSAAFFVTGTLTTGGTTTPHIIPARNSTDIVFTRDPAFPSRWLLASFDLAYTDSEDNEWVLTVTAPIWQ